LGTPLVASARKPGRINSGLSRELPYRCWCAPAATRQRAVQHVTA
jgi:hypothetical protein